MSIRRSDVLDVDFIEEPELISDGYSIYLPSIPVISTASSTKTITISSIPDGEGLTRPSGDHPVEIDDRVYIYDTNNGFGDGYFTIASIIDDTSFSVTQEIGDSTDGYVNFIWAAGSTKVGVDVTRIVDATATNLQGVLEELSENINKQNNFTAEKHKTLRQLIHFIDDGPADGFSSGAYKEITPSGSPFPTNITWYIDSSKSKKIVSKTLTLSPNKIPTTITWEIYKEDGVSIECTVTDNITYNSSGVFELSRTRSIS